MNLSLSEIAQAVNGKLYGEDLNITSVSTDSRDIPKGCLFIALVGDKFNGHDFVRASADKGAAACIVSENINTAIPKIVVENTGTALLALGGYYRSGFSSLKLIGLTGSVGKTTTKDMIYSVVSKKYSSIKTDGNLNNEIGMPKTLLRLSDITECAVIEMGMNHSGEIHRMSLAAKPDISVITNIGVSHIEYLGSRENIKKAKLEILDGMKKGSRLIINGDNDMLCDYENPDFDIIRYGIDNKACDFTAEDIVNTGNSTSFTVVYENKRIPIRIMSVGIHNVIDALAAFAVGKSLKIEDETVAAGLLSYVSSGMRQKITVVRGITFIEDCYNASPESVKAALSVLEVQESARHIAVLGDMLELGAYAEKAHREIGECLKDNKVDALFTYGTLAKEIALAAEKNIDEVYTFENKAELSYKLAAYLRRGDSVLFKASRAMKLEEAIDKIYKEWGV